MVKVLIVNNRTAYVTQASQLVLGVKNLLANAGDTGDGGLIPGSGRSSGGENCNPHQYSCLENPMDKGDWQAIVHKVPKTQTLLKRQQTQTKCYSILRWIN